MRVASGLLKGSTAEAEPDTVEASYDLVEHAIQAGHAGEFYVSKDAQHRLGSIVLTSDLDHLDMILTREQRLRDEQHHSDVDD